MWQQDYRLQITRSVKVNECDWPAKFEYRTWGRPTTPQNSTRYRTIQISVNTSSMEVEITFSFSTTDFMGYYNSSEGTLGEEPFKWTNKEIARMIQIIVRPILIIIGTIGNCMTVYIMRRTSLKDVSSCFYMCVLALADTGKWRSWLFYDYMHHVRLKDQFT